MTTPVKKFGSYYTGTILGHRVYAKLKWRDPWVLKEHVMCESASWAAAPSMGSATLYYRYGPGVYPGVEPGDWLAKFDLPTLAFVRIDFDVAELPDDQDLAANPTITTRSWYGVVGTLVEAFSGSDVQVNADDGGGGTQQVYVLQGKQTLNAVGLEWLLDRQYVNRTWYSVSISQTVREARRGLNFNLVGTKLQGNRSSEKYPAPNNSFTYIFNHYDLEPWTTTDIVEYLLGWHLGRNQSDLVNMPWKLADSSSLLRNDEYEMPAFNEVHGQTVWQLLNQLIARQRGYSFRVAVNGDTLTDSSAAEVQLIPFTLTADDIILRSPAEDAPELRIPANPVQYSIDLTNDRTASPIVITKDAFSEYDQVEVYGARAVHCVTLEWGGFDLEWEASNQTNYESGGSGDAGYPTGEIAEMQRWHAEYRSRPQFENVFRRFYINEDFQTPGGNPVFPDFDDPIGNPTDSERIVPVEELQVWDRVPLLADVDYTSRATFASSLPDDWKQRPLLPPTVYWEIDGKWYSGEKISVSQDVESPTEDDNFHFACRVTPADRPGYFYLDVFGQPQHVIAVNNFTPLADDKVIGGVDYEDAKITLAVLADYHAVGRYPANLEDEIDFDPDMPLRVRTVNAGDKYQFHLVLDGTVFKVDNGALETTSQTMIVRDDRKELEAIARMAFMWYGKSRRSMQFSTQFVTDAFEIGDLITTMIVDRDGSLFGTGNYDGEEINTCITSITIRNQLGAETQSPPSVEYKTEFSELDVISYFT